MNSKHLITLKAIFKDPVKSNLVWTEIEALFHALGAEVTEGNGSRVRVALKGVRAVFHLRTHKRKPTKALSNPSGAF